MDEQDEDPIGDIEAVEEVGPGSSAEAALRHILLRCAAEIDAHLAQVLDRDDAAGPHKARVWLRRLVTALDAFAPILKRRAKAGLRDEAKAIFRTLGKLRDHDVLLDRLGEAVPAKLVAASAELRLKVRQRLRDRNAVLFAPLMRRRLEDGTLFRAGADALGLRAGPVQALAVEALDLSWTACCRQKAGLRKVPASALHDFRKRLKTLRYLSEFFAPFVPAEGADAFRAALQRMQDLLGVATDAEAARALGTGKWAKADKIALHDALDEASAVWEALLMHEPWWRMAGLRH